MQIADLRDQPEAVLQQAAMLLVEEFDYSWPTPESARDEVASVLHGGFAFAMLGADLIGWVGGLPEYAGRVWELHPMVVRRDHRRRGVGRQLAAAFEREARRRGGLTATLGADDDATMTSLAGVNLYDNVGGHISTIRDLGRHHPFLFYRKLGYVVTGVVPDANGPGKPDILMAKRLLEF